MLCSRVTSLGCLCTGREEGENRVTDGLHYRKIESPSRCEELKRKISQIGVHSPERSNAFSGGGSPGICGCPWERRGCLAQLQRSSHIETSATEKVDPKPTQPFLVLNSTLLWERCQADLNVEHTNPLAEFMLQSEYYPAESIPSAQH